MEKITTYHAERIKESILKEVRGYITGLMLLYGFWIVFLLFLLFSHIRNPSTFIESTLQGSFFHIMALAHYSTWFVFSLIAIHIPMSIVIWAMGGWPWSLKQRKFASLGEALKEGRTLNELKEDPELAEHLEEII